MLWLLLLLLFWLGLRAAAYRSSALADAVESREACARTAHRNGIVGKGRWVSSPAVAAAAAAAAAWTGDRALPESQEAPPID